MTSVWNNPKAVRALARVIFGISQIPPSTSYQQIASAISRDQGREIGHQNIRNFALRHTEKPTNFEHFDALAVYAKHRLEESRQIGKRYIQEALEDYDVIAAFARSQFAAAPGLEESGPSFEMYDGLLEFLKPYLHISEGSHSEVASLLTEAGERRLSGLSSTEQRGHFICYRYSSQKGRVAKSFMVIFPPDIRCPMCSFKNFYVDTLGNQRNTEGIVLMTELGIYFMGSIADGMAIKSLVIPRL